MRYRADIDGLRAIAILPVVLFHAGTPLVTGGFVGVDIFFVISGYLIASLVLEQIARDQFSLITFYERRIRRILPALVVVIAVSSLLAAVLFLPSDFETFSKSVVSVALSFSNVFFWQHSGYFEGSAETQPLLHTWSLAVEEQFYATFPLFILLVNVFRSKLTVWVSLAFALSFFLSIWSAANMPEAAFYLAPTRAWELLLGVLLALKLIPPHKSQILRELIPGLGLVLIGWSVFSFSEATPFPGINALIPCLGTALLLQGGESGSSYVTRFLSIRPLVFLGLISYSLYLWHWPLLVFARFYVIRPLAPLEISAVLALSFGTAVLSWHFIEKPFRSKDGTWTRMGLFRATAAVMAAAMAFGVFGQVSQGWPERFNRLASLPIPGPEQFNSGTCFMHRTQRHTDWQKTKCLIVQGKGQTALLWGDSFAAHLVPGLVRSHELMAQNVLQYTAALCPPIRGIHMAKRPHCHEFNKHAEELIKDKEIETVIMAARWDHYMQRKNDLGEKRPFTAMLQDTVDWLNRNGKNVILIGQTPSFGFNSPLSHYLANLSSTAETAFDPDLNERLRQASRGAQFIDPLPYLCTKERCSIVNDRGELLFYDDGHFSAVGSEKLIKAIVGRLNRDRSATAWLVLSSSRERGRIGARRKLPLVRAPQSIY